MIIKDKLKLVDEKCCLCNCMIPRGSAVLRHVRTTNIICIICLFAIAEAKI